MPWSQYRPGPASGRDGLGGQRRGRAASTARKYSGRCQLVALVDERVYDTAEPAQPREREDLEGDDGADDRERHERDDWIERNSTLQLRFHAAESCRLRAT